MSNPQNQENTLVDIILNSISNEAFGGVVLPRGESRLIKSNSTPVLYSIHYDAPWGIDSNNTQYILFTEREKTEFDPKNPHFSQSVISNDLHIYLNNFHNTVVDLVESEGTKLSLGKYIRDYLASEQGINYTSVGIFPGDGFERGRPRKSLSGERKAAA